MVVGVAKSRKRAPGAGLEKTARFPQIHTTYGCGNVTEVTYGKAKRL